MKRTIALVFTLALALTVPAFIRSDSVTKAQTQDRSVYDTGLVTLGPNQKLRLTFSARGDSGSLVVNEQVYSQQGCTIEGACRHAIDSQTTVGPINLGGAQSVTIDIPNSGSGVRAVARTNIKSLVVTATWINASTGESFMTVVLHEL